MNLSMLAKQSFTWALWIILLGLILFVCVFATLAIYGTVTRTATSKLYPMPGELVSVGNHKLHLYCTGRGTHTVVLESGGGSWSMDWLLVQPELSNFSRVCSYDRAGFGWSESASGDRDFSALVNELDEVLTKGGIDPPYILVGASLGGALVQMYAEKFPNKVSGLLLLDARGKRSVTDLLEMEPSLLPPSVVPRLAKQLGALNILHGLLKVRGTEAILTQAHSNFHSYPDRNKEIYLDSTVMSNNLLATAAEAVADPISEEQLDKIQDFGDLPLTVITHGHENRFDGLSLSSKKRTEIENEWLRQQEEMAKLSTNGEMLIAEKSGHLIQLDQPQIIIEQVKNLISRIDRD